MTTLELNDCSSCYSGSSARYLGAVVVHGQHAEHVQGVPTFDELPHGVLQDALASLLCARRFVSGRVGQLVHADDAVLRWDFVFIVIITTETLNQGSKPAAFPTICALLAADHLKQVCLGH